MLADGQKVRSLRTNRPWTQDVLAAASGTTSRTIQRIEAGKGCSIESLRAIASALQVDFEQLLAPQTSAAEMNATREEVNAEFRKRAEIRQQLDQTLTQLAGYWEEQAPGWRLTQADKKDLEKWLGSYSLSEILAAMDKCALQYLQLLPNGLCTTDSAGFAFKKIPAVCRVNQSEPWERDLYFIRGSVRNRMSYFDDRRGMQLLKAAYAAGASIERIRGTVSLASNWTEFREGLEVLAATPTAEAATVHRQPQEPSPEILRSLPRGEIRAISESVAVVAATKGLTAPAEKAAEVLQQGVKYEELLLTIDSDRCVYYFGRSRDGSGRTYGIEQPWTVRVLADAIENDFEFAP
jgi:transcriptional regulator with XRE-family HTH domain